MGTNTSGLSVRRPIASVPLDAKESISKMSVYYIYIYPGDSLESHKFVENIGQANVFHEFP